MARNIAATTAFSSERSRGCHRKATRRTVRRSSGRHERHARNTGCRVSVTAPTTAMTEVSAGMTNHQAAHASTMIATAPALQRAERQDGDRRIERQHIMRQFGQHQFKYNPGRDQHASRNCAPGSASPPDRGAAIPASGAPAERHPEQQQIDPGGAPWIPAPRACSSCRRDRIREKSIAGAPEDRDEPG